MSGIATAIIVELSPSMKKAQPIDQRDQDPAAGLPRRLG